MKKAKLELVTINEDVIATSGNVCTFQSNQTDPPTIVSYLFQSDGTSNYNNSFQQYSFGIKDHNLYMYGDGSYEYCGGEAILGNFNETVSDGKWYHIECDTSYGNYKFVECKNHESHNFIDE